jgi:catechol 2,3-dioxygenase-like lactoylglutathione lyase family enzyme
MNLTHIQIVSIPVLDVDRAKRFYNETLGFELIMDNQFGEGQRWVQLAPKGAQTAITLVNWFPSMPAGSLKGLVLATDDVEAAYKELLSRGVKFGGALEDAPWGRYATFDDSEGNGWVLQGAPARPS